MMSLQCSRERRKLYPITAYFINPLKPSDAIIYGVKHFGQHWFRYWLVACAAPNHYPKQCCLIGPLRTNLSEIFIEIQTYLLKKMQTYLLKKIHVKMSDILSRPQCVNSLGLSGAYMRHQRRPSLVQIMACRLFGTKPLSEPMLYYCQLNP